MTYRFRNRPVGMSTRSHRRALQREEKGLIRRLIGTTLRQAVNKRVVRTVADDPATS